MDYRHLVESAPFFRGMLSGIVPSDLGMKDAFNNNALANAGINVARDGLRGAIINGKDGAKLSVGTGLVHNGFGHTFGLLSSGFDAPKFEGGGWHYNVKFLPNAAAITFGNVVSYKRPLLTKEHVGDQSALGLAYFPTHIASQGIGGSFFGIQNAFMEQAPYMHEYPYSTMPDYRH